jgi:hypothetical protein
MRKMQQVLLWEFTMRETGLYYDIPLQGDYCLDFNEQISMSEDRILEISILCSEEVIENRSLIS